MLRIEFVKEFSQTGIQYKIHPSEYRRSYSNFFKEGNLVFDQIPDLCNLWTYFPSMMQIYSICPVYLVTSEEIEQHNPINKIEQDKFIKQIIDLIEQYTAIAEQYAYRLEFDVYNIAEYLYQLKNILTLDSEYTDENRTKAITDIKKKLKNSLTISSSNRIYKNGSVEKQLTELLNEIIRLLGMLCFPGPLLGCYLHGEQEQILILPEKKIELPSREFLEWHNEHVFLG